MTPAEYRTIAESLGITQAFLAERTGMSEGRVYNLGSSRRTLDVPERATVTLLDLANTFDEALADAIERYRDDSAAGLAESVACHTDADAFHAEHPKLDGWPLSSQWPLLVQIMVATKASVVYA